MSELTKTMRRITLEGREWSLNETMAVLDAHERLEAEHEAFMEVAQTDHRELQRLEGLLRAWGTEAPDAETYHRREEAVYAEAVRLAKATP